MTLLLWVIFSAMVAVAAAGLAIPLVRRYDAQARERDAVTAVLRDQLVEIDGQAASGSVLPGEADALRTEIKRRLLVENRALPLPARLLGDRTAARGALALGVVVALGATALYAVRGRPDLGGAEPQVASAAAVDPAAGVAPLIGQLEARMAAAPNDPEGWKMLGWSYAQTGRFADAAAAYGKAVALAPNGEGYASAYGEALVQAANGVVTPAAAKAFADARGLDANDPRARYFLAVARDQRGDRKGAIDDWIALLRDAPAGATWVPELRSFVATTAGEAGIDVAGRLPAVAPGSPPVEMAVAPPPVLAGAANARGPSAADVASAQAMAPVDRQAFIRGMVDNLAAKLKDNPRDADGWLRLIRARTVLGDKGAAKAALAEGQAAFRDQPAVQKSLADAAAKLGVA